MSWNFARIALLLFAFPTFAAPRDKSPTPEAQAAGAQFARQVGAVAQMIAREYARPIGTSEMYQAAVAAIYSAARQPQPTTLLRDLRAAKNETERIDLVARARAAIHDAPGIADGRDLFAAFSSFTTVLDPHSILVPNGVLSGTPTSNVYGFDFEGENTSQVMGRRPRLPRIPDEDLPEPRDTSGTPTLPFRVLNVKPGSPAQKAGLRPGDIVRDIDGSAADVHDSAKAFAALHSAGPDKANPGVHQLTIDRTGCDELKRLRLERTDFIPESLFGITRKADNTWDYWLDRERRIAYVRLGAIENDSGDRLSDLLHDLGDVRGLVFDVRWCPGGYIDAATQIASTFLDSGVIAKMKYRNPDRGSNTDILADGGLIRFKAGDYPVLLLVNGETIGGGELIAAALKDNGRAVLAGTRTYGKASIQWPVGIPSLPGYSFKLTGGMYSRPNGKNLQRFPDSKSADDWGLRPDPGFEIPMSADLGRKLKELHTLYALRPGGSREAMDLDDPAADPQRSRALKLMRKLVEEKALRKGD